MHPDTLGKAMALAEHLDHFLLATVAPDGQPHIAAAGELSLLAGGRIEITDWFCATTVRNLQANPRISVVVWDLGHHRGFQLLGVVEKEEDIAIMDGYVPELEAGETLPQVERLLVVRIEKILDFSQQEQGDTEV